MPTLGDRLGNVVLATQVNGHFCEDESHGENQVESVVGIGVGQPGGYVRWLCQEHYEEAMYEIGNRIREARLQPREQEEEA